ANRLPLIFIKSSPVHSAQWELFVSAVSCAHRPYYSSSELTVAILFSAAAFIPTSSFLCISSAVFLVTAFATCSSIVCGLLFVIGTVAPISFFIRFHSTQFLN